LDALGAQAHSAAAMTATTDREAKADSKSVTNENVEHHTRTSFEEATAWVSQLKNLVMSSHRQFTLVRGQMRDDAKGIDQQHMYLYPITIDKQPPVLHLWVAAPLPQAR